MMIGIIPIALAIGTRLVFGSSNLSKLILTYMILISIWQADVAVLYFKGTIPEAWILILFKLFKMAPIYSVPLLFYGSYTILNNYSISFQKNSLLEKISKMFSKKILIALLIWSTIVYIINWTPLGTNGLTEVQVLNTNIFYYFPVYGTLNWLFYLHVIGYITFISILFLFSKKIQNQYMMKFIRSFSLYSFLLLLFALMNFLPKTGGMAGTIGVLVFSVLIMVSFLKMNLLMTIKFNQMIGQQKKMDYAGNLAASLIHEVKNVVQVIKGFNQLLGESPSLNQSEKEMTDIINKATRQLEDLSENYKQFIHSSKIHFKIEDLNEIIKESIDFASEITKDTNLSIQFDQRFSTLKGYVNKPYLQQVFINLIKNSSEAFREDCSTRIVKIETEVVNETILIHFKDTGIGIKPCYWESVFDPFISSKSSGMGMGLPFAKKIILEHRGDINIITSSPNGTHFQIELPQYELNL